MSVCFVPKDVKENLKSDADYQKQLEESFRRAFLSMIVSLIYMPRFNEEFRKIVNDYARGVPVISLPIEKPKLKGGALGFGDITKGITAGLNKEADKINKMVSGATNELNNVASKATSGLNNVALEATSGLSEATSGLSEATDQVKQSADAKKAFDNKVKNAGQTVDLAHDISPLVNATANDIGGLLSGNIPGLGNVAAKSGTKSGLPSGIAELHNIAGLSGLNALLSTGLKVVGLGNSKKNLIKSIAAGICEHIRRTKQGLVMWAKRNQIQIVEMMLNKHIGTLTQPKTFDPKPPIRPVATECLDDPEINEKLEAFNKQMFDILDPFLGKLVAELVSYVQVEIAGRIQIKEEKYKNIIFKPKKIIVAEPEEPPPRYEEVEEVEEAEVSINQDEPPTYKEVEEAEVSVTQGGPPTYEEAVYGRSLPVATPVNDNAESQMFPASAMPSPVILNDNPIKKAADTQNQVQTMLKAAVPFATAIDTAMNTSQFFYLKEQLLRRLKYMSDSFATSKSSNYDKTPFENWCLEQFYNKLVAYDTNDWLGAYEQPKKASDDDDFGDLFQGGRRNKRRSKKRRRKRTAKRRTIRR